MRYPCRVGRDGRTWGGYVGGKAVDGMHMREGSRHVLCTYGAETRRDVGRRLVEMCGCRDAAVQDAQAHVLCFQTKMKSRAKQVSLWVSGL